MPQYTKQIGLGEQVAALMDRVARLERRSPTVLDAGSLLPTSFHGLVYEDSTSYVTYFETTVTAPRHAASIGLVFLGDQVGTTNSGGLWQVLLNGSLPAGASGGITANFSFQFAAVVLDLSALSGQVHIEVQGRRTAGATTGGRYGTGGTIGIGVRWCNYT